MNRNVLAVLVVAIILLLGGWWLFSGEPEEDVAVAPSAPAEPQTAKVEPVKPAAGTAGSGSLSDATVTASGEGGGEGGAGTSAGSGSGSGGGAQAGTTGVASGSGGGAKTQGETAGAGSGTAAGTRAAGSGTAEAAGSGTVTDQTANGASGAASADTGTGDAADKVETVVKQAVETAVKNTASAAEGAAGAVQSAADAARDTAAAATANQVRNAPAKNTVAARAPKTGSDNDDSQSLDPVKPAARAVQSAPASTQTEDSQSGTPETEADRPAIRLNVEKDIVRAGQGVDQKAASEGGTGDSSVIVDTRDKIVVLTPEKATPETEPAKAEDAAQPEQPEQGEEPAQGSSTRQVAKLTEAPAKAAPQPAEAPSATQIPAPAAPAILVPSFDVVRISNDTCTAVIAGRAEPYAAVTLLGNGRALATLEANADGEWVHLITEALQPGSITLSIRSAAGDAVALSDADVVLIVPDCASPSANETAVAVLAPKKDTETTVLQAPAAAKAPASQDTDKAEEEPKAKPEGLNVGKVDYDEEGNIAVSGSSDPDKEVRAYVDGQLVGRAEADEKGDWKVVPEKEIEPGVHTLRVDQVDEQGVVLARVELPFARARPGALALTEDRIVVQPGNSLWRIARRTYGDGVSYTTIYQANSDRIRDPDLIYPGQVFRLPPLGERS